VPQSSADEPHPADAPDLFHWAKVALGVGLFALLASGAVGVYKVWLTATVRPAEDVPVERCSPAARHAWRVRAVGTTDCTGGHQTR